MSADAEMVPVAWLLDCYGDRTLTFVAPDAETLKTTDATPLYSADTIAALRKDAERYRFLRNNPLDESVPHIRAAKHDRMRWGLRWNVADEAIDAAIDAAQSKQSK